jgi:hypothetical protein
MNIESMYCLLLFHKSLSLKKSQKNIHPLHFFALPLLDVGNDAKSQSWTLITGGGTEMYGGSPRVRVITSPSSGVLGLKIAQD